jgi:hypothetical protein
MAAGLPISIENTQNAVGFPVRSGGSNVHQSGWKSYRARMATLGPILALRVRWDRCGFITDGRPHLPKSCAAVAWGRRMSFLVGVAYA